MNLIQLFMAFFSQQSLVYTHIMSLFQFNMQEECRSSDVMQYTELQVHCRVHLAMINYINIIMLPKIASSLYLISKYSVHCHYLTK